MIFQQMEKVILLISTSTFLIVKLLLLVHKNRSTSEEVNANEG